MHSVNFYLKSPNSKSETLIYLFVANNGERLKISTHQKIHPELWDSKKKRVIQNDRIILKHKSFDSGVHFKIRRIQESLDNLNQEIERYFTTIGLENRKVTKDGLKNHLTEYLSPTPTEKKLSPNICGFIELFIGEASAGNRKQSTGFNYSAGTLKNYKNLLRTLRSYEEDMGIQLDWDLVNKQLYSSFMQWQEKKGFSINYRGKHSKDLKSIMRLAFEEDLHVNTCFQKRWFAVPTGKKKKVPLTMEEVALIQKVNLGTNRTLNVARDVFLIGCYTGLRVSDIKRITPSIIKEVEGKLHIEIKTQKTGANVLIPVNSELNTILKKYDYTTPKFAEQVVNRKIKQIGIKAGIPENNSLHISLHIGRHSFATFLYSQGVPAVILMALTGHSSEKNFMKYINLKPEQIASKFRELDFFK